MILFTKHPIIFFQYRGISGEKLIRDLLVTYEEVTPHGRPVVSDNTTVNVQFGLGLIQMELDEKEKALSLSLWAKYVNMFMHSLLFIYQNPGEKF